MTVPLSFSVIFAEDVGIRNELYFSEELGKEYLGINGESYRMREREGTLPKSGTGQRGRPRKQAATEASEELLEEIEHESMDE